MPSDPTDQDLEQAREVVDRERHPLDTARGLQELEDAIATLLADTRERCAVIAESTGYSHKGYSDEAKRIAAAIRGSK